jgi:hypothetical protein
MASTAPLRFLTRPVGLLAAAGVVGALTIGGVLLTRPDGSDVALSAGAVDSSLPASHERAPTTVQAPTGTILLPGASVPAVLPAFPPAPDVEVPSTTEAAPPAEEPAPPTTSSEPGPTTTEPPPEPEPTTSTSTRPVRPGRLLVSDGQLISVLNADGSGRRTVVQGTAPAWHPDGRQLAFVFDGGIWAIDADDPSAPRAISHHGSAPAWSPDGSQLAFVRTVGGRDQVWLVAADGSGARSAIGAGDPSFAASRAPSWSPDGLRLVFAFGDGASPASGLATVPVADPAAVSVVAYDSQGCCENSAPAWSPDGTRVAFRFVDVSRPGLPSAIRVLGLFDGAVVDVLGGATTGPAWAPDGLEVLARNGSGLAAAAPDGTGPTRVVLVSGQLDGERPSWR